MSGGPAGEGGRLLSGTTGVFLAEALILPTGLVVTAFLTRKLGPEGYGLYILASSIVAWITWGISGLFSRATVKLVSEATDWRPVATVVIRIYLLVSAAMTAILLALARPAASLLDAPRLAGYLRLYALDIPIFGLGSAYRNIAVGRGQFKARSLMAAGRWLSKLVLVLLLVELGLSISGAIIANIGASLVYSSIGAAYVRRGPFGRADFPTRRLLGYAVPLSMFALSMRTFDKLDLLMVKAMGATVEQAGLYGAVQNLALVPGLLALSFSPLLLSTLGRMKTSGHAAEALEVARNSMRVMLLLLPFAGMTAGAAREISVLIFGSAFAPAGPWLALLIFGGVAKVMISVGCAILTAADRPTWPILVSGPILVLAAAGYLIVIPHMEAYGAAMVSTLFAFLGGAAMVIAVRVVWGILPSGISLVRTSLVSVLAYYAASFWPASGPGVVLKLFATVVIICLALFAVREVTSKELSWVRSVFYSRGVSR